MNYPFFLPELDRYNYHHFSESYMNNMKFGKFNTKLSHISMDKIELTGIGWLHFAGQNSPGELDQVATLYRGGTYWVNWISAATYLVGQNSVGELDQHGYTFGGQNSLGELDQYGYIFGGAELAR